MVNGEISNAIAGAVWLSVGVVCAVWVAAGKRELREDLGTWWPFKIKTGSAEENRVFRLWGRIAILTIGWVALFVALDWAF